jgi:hypothetical protein
MWFASSADIAPGGSDAIWDSPMVLKLLIIAPAENCRRITQ